jgi:hypothetical protein
MSEDEKDKPGFTITYKVAGLVLAGNIGWGTVSHVLHLPKDDQYIVLGLGLKTSTSSTGAMKIDERGRP